MAQKDSKLIDRLDSY